MYQSKDMSFMKQSCFVYGLVCPIERRTFYIGISNNPWVRFAGHRNDWASSALPKVRKLLGLGFTRDDILCVVRECPTRDEALEIERTLIGLLPDLVNLDGRRQAA